MDTEVPGNAHRACIQVSIKPFDPVYADDALLLRRYVESASPLRLKDVIAWTRLVIWENLDTKARHPHVNVATDLSRLLAALIQDFTKGPGPCAYMTDYDQDRIVFRQGKEPYPDLIPIPDELVPLVGTGAT
jgi:hypothetical protein